MTKCPECLSEDLQSLGIEHGERIDDEHTILVSRYTCKKCGCEFREIQVTSWRREILRHGCPEWLIMAEWTR
jgi:transposase-like protein